MLETSLNVLTESVSWFGGLQLDFGARGICVFFPEMFILSGYLCDLVNLALNSGQMNTLVLMEDEVERNDIPPV